MQTTKKLKILMLEDNPDDVGLIERVLHKDKMDFISQRVDTRDEFYQVIKTFAPDVILSDHGMPEFNSIEALKISLKERAFAPFILVTGTVSEEFAAVCLKLGADDYILKSNLSRLPSAIHRALKERKLIHLKREARRALRKQNDALLKANEELLKVNSELDNFVYSVSHNLRAPLTSVMGLINLGQTEEKNENIERIFGMMNQSVLRLDETLREIIDYSKNARNGIEVSEIDFEELVKTTIKKLAYRDPDQAINWLIDVEQQTILKTDRDRLQVIMNNVLTNAMCYRASARRAIVSISAKITQDELKVSIVDNGIGIRPEILPKVFEMFYRGTEKSQGAGLGLYVTRETIKRLNGTIEIESRLENGTTVEFRIPNTM
jgi:signal transduction histidine kinase